VIRHTELFFLNVTDVAYQGVYSPLSSSGINVTDAAGNIRKPQQVSRGNREPPFLALRFGLILEMCQHSEHLPVTVDTALVNFNPTRGIKPAGEFEELPEPNQLLGPTCHSHIVDWFIEAAAQRCAAPPEIVQI